jgi:uncharacterized protein
MKWRGRQKSGNVEDRRGGGMGKYAVGGVGGVIILILSLLFGGDPGALMDLGTNPTTTSGQRTPNPAYEEQAEFVQVVLKETEDVFNRLFPEQLNRPYDEPTLVLFEGRDQSGCGTATAASGPFYCPLDEKVYIDLSFSDQLRKRFQAPGEFAMAYVIAHEVGHHIQHQLGIASQVRQQQSRLSKADANALSVRLELQADFLAGVWAHHANRMNLLEEGDIEAALQAANAIGDDNMQKQAQGYVVPESFTHGTSKQRMYWFKRGYQTGDIRQGDTFNDPN